jgi:hypothetical protein
MIVCYLDDSGKDKQNPFTTLAGFAAPVDAWSAFERAVEPIFIEFQVPVLHTMDLLHSDGAFAGWTVLKKQAFVAKICGEMKTIIPFAATMSVHKAAYARRGNEARGKKEFRRKRIRSPYAYCFHIVLDWLLTDIEVGRLVHSEGLSVVLEAGHENNHDAKHCFEVVRDHNHLEGVLRSIRCEEKTACRAIQMADLLAFYSRRHIVKYAATSKAERESSEPDVMLKIIAECVNIRAAAGIDFELLAITASTVTAGVGVSDR